MSVRVCAKCLKISGDDWSQCKGRCPVPFSPHYHLKTADSFALPQPQPRMQLPVGWEEETDGTP